MRYLRYIISLVGILLGIIIGNWIAERPMIMRYIPYHNALIVYFFTIIISILIIFFIYPYCIVLIKRLIDRISIVVKDENIVDLSLQVLGLIIGLVIAMLISTAFSSFPVYGVGWIISALIYLILGVLGWTLPGLKKDEIKRLINSSRRPKDYSRRRNRKELAGGKLLDTSVLIDGRIIDIFRTNFIEGPLIIPVYVLNELQLISDSDDIDKRNKGRRGLDLVAELQEQFKNKIVILEEDYGNLKDVDRKLVRTAKEKKFKIITNDYNLNKLASVQGIEILNINDLANAVKIILTPGDEIDVKLIKKGKDQGQAVGYMDDGTMIVVENASPLIGEKPSVIVTSVLQTSAGRMIFAKKKEAA